MITKEQVAEELELAARGIDYNSPEWFAVARWLRAKQWAIAASMVGPMSEVQAAHNRGRWHMAEDLLQLAETNRRPSED